MLSPSYARAQASEAAAPTQASEPAATPPPPAPASSAEPHALLPVVVTAESLDDSQPKELEKYGTRVTRVTSKELQSLGSVDVAEGLEVTVPGLYVSPKNGPFDYVNVSLQGSRTQDVLWLLDGVRLNNRLYGGTTPLDTFPASIVDHLEVLDGTQALLYGTQAVAGAINVVTKPFSSELGGSFAVGADTSGGRHLDAFVRDGIGKHEFVIYGSSDHSTGFQPFRDRDYQPSATDRHRSYDVLTLGAKYAYQITSQLRVSTLYQHTAVPTHRCAAGLRHALRGRDRIQPPGRRRTHRQGRLCAERRRALHCQSVSTRLALALYGVRQRHRQSGHPQ